MKRFEFLKDTTTAAEVRPIHMERILKMFEAMWDRLPAEKESS